MHISLDSALGRQRRLNSVGESVLQIAPNAAAAYSLRSLTGGDPKVVRVRRGSNNVESDFTASGVSSGALLDFVTTPQIGWNSQPTFSNDSGTGSVTSQSSTATTATVSFTGDAALIRETSKPNHVLGSSGDQVIFNISVSGLDSAMTFRLRTSGTNTSVASQSVSNGDNQDITLNLTGSAGYLAITAVASSGGTITFNSIKVLPKSGFVETWYDQSGNGNDAVQATAGSQPKIVNAGALLADGLTFDGSDDSMATTSAISSTNIAIACVSKSTNNATAGIFSMLDGFNDGHEALYLAGKIRIASNSSDLDVSITTTNQNLYFANYDGSTQSLSSNGGTPSTKSTSQTISVNAVGQIGSRAGSNKLNGSIEELIVYTSDQSANRAALETNIISHYGIS